jgi:hypothetical protein
MRRLDQGLTITTAHCGAFDMRLPPNVHAFVLVTAFLTSISFAILAMNVLAAILFWMQ